jgi:hypothetical protein
MVKRCWMTLLLRITLKTHRGHKIVGNDGIHCCCYCCSYYRRRHQIDHVILGIEHGPSIFETIVKAWGHDDGRLDQINIETSFHQQHSR